MSTTTTSRVTGKRRNRGQPKASTLSTPAQWLVDALCGDQAATKVHVNERTAMSVSAVFACVRAISEDVAKVPLLLKRENRRSGVKQEAFDHPLYNQLRQSPNPDMVSLTYRRTVTMSSLLFGNGYAEIIRNGAGDVVAQLPIHPLRVTPDRDDSQRLFYRVLNDDGREVVISQDRMLHIPGIGSGVVGYSILKLGKEAIGLMIAAERFASTFFGSGTRLSGVLTHPQTLGKAAADQLRASWEKMHSGADNQNKVAILEEGLEFKPMSVPPEEAQMLETRILSVAEACRFFRVPPHKVFELTRSTNNNIEHQSLEYVGDSLYTWFALWEQEIKRKLIKPSEKDLFAEHKYQNLLMGDMAARSTRQREMFNVGAMTINEIRRENNMNPVGPEGDVRFVNAAMVPVEIAIRGPKEAESAPSEPGNAVIPPVAPPRDGSARIAAIAPRYVDLLAGEFGRILALEADRVSAATKRHGFAAWAEEFYRGHVDHVRGRIGAIVDAYADSIMAILTDRAYDEAYRAAVTDLTRQIAERHVSRSVAEMREPSLVREWSSVRAMEEAANEVLNIPEFIINLAGIEQ